MASADVTRRELTLGNIDSHTGWYAKSFAETTIKMILRPRGQVVHGLSVGYYAKYDLTGFTVDIVEEGDEIIDATNTYYEVKTVEEEWFLDGFSHRVCNLVKLPLHADRSSTSGSWASVDDPQHRQKVFLDKYLSAANLTKDDGTTKAKFITCFAEPDYSAILKVFLPTTKNVDVVFAIVKATSSEPLQQATRSPYGYEETVPVQIFTMNKTGITAVNLEWKAAHEIRRVLETHPFGSYRGFTRTRDVSQDFGSFKLYGTEYVWRYKRGVT